MNCPRCGSVLSAVTFTCVRGEYCKPSLPLPTMEAVDAERSVALERQRADDMSATLRAPLASITQKTRDIEANSPLFRDSEASGQAKLF